MRQKIFNKIRIKIIVELDDAIEADILHRSVCPENNQAPPNVEIKQERFGNTILFSCTLTDEKIPTLRRTVDDFLASLCLATRITKKLMLQYENKNDGKYK